MSYLDRTLTWPWFRSYNFDMGSVACRPRGADWGALSGFEDTKRVKRSVHYEGRGLVPDML